MSIKTEINSANQAPKETFPCLRQWVGEGAGGPVVLFTSPDEGVPLAGTAGSRIGKMEEWANYEDRRWVPCSITVTSET